jgi:hypothetical protein
MWRDSEWTRSNLIADPLQTRCSSFHDTKLLGAHSWNSISRSEESAMRRPTAGNCGASRWCGHVRQASTSRTCCRSRSFRNRVPTVRQHFARWREAHGSGASSRRVRVWQASARPRWLDWRLRRCRCRRSGQVSPSRQEGQDAKASRGRVCPSVERCGNPAHRFGAGNRDSRDGRPSHSPWCGEEEGHIENAAW